MVVQHNLTAMNSNRMLGLTTTSQAKSTERLSSGYKINRAADDAAGLSISEKMRKQIRGLTQASANAQDGISAVQTAEGALTEVHDMLQRMNELAVKAANGTQSANDRSYIQDEIDQLITEIDRVSETTKFNETYLLKGDTDGVYTDMKVNAHDAGINGELVDKGDTAIFSLEKALEDGDTIKIAGEEYTIGGAGSANSGNLVKLSEMNRSTDGYADIGTTANFITFSGLEAGDSFTVDGETYTLTDKVSMDDIVWGNGDTFKIGEYYYKIAAKDSGVVAGESDGGVSTPEEVTIDTAKKLIEEALASGKQVCAETFAVYNEAGVSVKVTDATAIVDEYNENEVSMVGITGELLNYAKKATGDPNIKLEAGDSYTKDGKTITALDNPTAARDVYNSIVNVDVAAGSTITIGTGKDAKTYTIVGDNEDEDAASYKLHKDTILAMIHDGDVVTLEGGKAQTVVGDIGLPESGAEEKTISAAEAYAKIADELAKASSIGADEGSVASVTSDGKGGFTISKAVATVKEALSFNLHVGADADMTNKIGVTIDAMSAAGLGIRGLEVFAVDASGKTINDGGVNATYAIDAIADAIQKVSTQRSALGAVQNRLEHTINNLDNVVENTSAESQIRDTDMATEMVKYSNNNILAQAGQAMLAQANQANQGVLSLLG